MRDADALWDGQVKKGVRRGGGTSDGRAAASTYTSAHALAAATGASSLSWRCVAAMWCVCAVGCAGKKGGGKGGGGGGEV